MTKALTNVHGSAVTRICVTATLLHCALAAASTGAFARAPPCEVLADFDEAAANERWTRSTRG